MSGGCTRHPSSVAAGSCRQCASGFCEDCLVFPFGEGRPPMCIGCALAFAGVRPGAAGRSTAERPKKRFGRKRPAGRVEPAALPAEYVFDPDEPLFS